MLRLKIQVLLFLLLTIMPVFLRADTSITYTPGTFTVTPPGIDEMEVQIQDLLDSYGPAMANAYAMANIAGYPMGKGHLGSFPHFFIGISASVGMSNLEYFDDDADVDDDVYPAFAVNPAVYLGLGLGQHTDFMAKIMLYSTGFYRPSIDNEMLSLDKMNIYSVGGKLRYNYCEPETILPGLFNFGGLTFSIGADMMYGVVSFTGSTDYTLEGIEVNPGPTIVDLEFAPDYDFEISWFIISVNVQSLVYLNVFTILDFYTGLGFCVNYGHFSMDADATGSLTETATSTDFGSLAVDSSNSYHPYYYFPIYIVGVDINLSVLKITAESMVNLRNASDINVQIGTRIQF